MIQLRRQSLKIGFIRLSDAAPLIVASEKNYFHDEGLDVELSLENSWSQIRDKLSAGVLDASHLLAPMAPASWLESDAAQEPFVTGLALNLNGSAITVSDSLYEEMTEVDPEAMIERPISARALKAVLARRLERGQETITFGAVFPYSSHYYAIRYWLGAEGIDPDRDVRMVVAPPPVMVEQLEQGLIDAFCVGEPWSTVAESRGSGRAIIRSSEIWRHMPEKVLGVRARWADANPGIHSALVRAVLRACIWLDAPQNRIEAAHILSMSQYVGVNSGLLATALAGWPSLRHRRSILQSNDSLIFHHYAANFPWKSHAMWFLSQMARWGQISSPFNIEDVADKAYRQDTYREAAKDLGIACPRANTKLEGAFDRSWILESDGAPIPMSSDGFIDGAIFNPAQPLEYLEGFSRHNLRIRADEIMAPTS